MSHHHNSQPRDRTGRWTDGSIPSHIRKKIDAAKPQEEKDEEELIRQIQEAEEKGLDSMQMHQDENGNFTPERQKLHDEIMNDVLNKGTSKTGQSWHLGGAPANGKSSLVDSGFIGNPANIVHVDPDAIKARLPEYQIMNQNRVVTAASFTHEESSYLSKRIMERGGNSGQDMLIDGVGDGGIDKIEAKIAQMKKAGLSTKAHYVTLDTDLSLKLADARGKKTGRYVPEAYTREMNRKISVLVPQLVERKSFDELNLWDTNISGKPRLILSQKQGVTTIHDQNLYDNFLKKAR